MTKPRYTIIITGNHHTPAIELIHQLQQDPDFDWQIHYLSQLNPNETHLQHTIIPKLNINFHPINSGKFHRRYLPETLRGIPLTFLALIKSISLLSSLKPHLVISFGGYSSVPVIIAAWFLRLPSITHEQTPVPSLATKINSYFVRRIALSFTPHPWFIHHFPQKIHQTGNLIRHQIFNPQSLRFHHLEPSLKKYPLLYITGGNQGAHRLNQLILSLLPKLTSHFTIIHQTGPIDRPWIQQQLDSPIARYYPQDYIDIEDIGWVFHQTSLIISRSGANICQEIAAFKTPSVLVPLPFSQQNEQLLNAQWLQQQNPDTIILNESRLDAATLLKAIYQLNPHYSNRQVNPIINYQLRQLIHQLL